MKISGENEDNTKNNARRKILRSIVAGGGAFTAAKVTPREWIKPVIENVILPGHAQTSAVTSPVSPFGSFTSGPVMVDMTNQNPDQLIADESISKELLEFFMPSAQAQIGCSNSSCNVEFSADVQNASMFVCLSGDDSGYGKFPTTSDPSNPSLVSGGRISSCFAVGGGEFRGGRWQLEVTNFCASNSSTIVTLSRGVGNCGSIDA